MTKKHYEALAAAIVRARAQCARGGPGHAQEREIGVDLVAHEIAEVLQAQGRGLFDPERFLAACGIEP